MHQQRFPDVSGILEAIEADANGFDRYWDSTARLPPEVPDFERKYSVNDERRSIPERRLTFQSLVHSLSTGRQRTFSIKSSEVFSGVDEGFEFEGDASSDTIVTHRLRFGSNRPCQWTTKSRKKGDDGTERNRASVSIAYRDLPKIRSSLIRTSKTVVHSRHLLVGQSGEFWFVDDIEGYLVEIALYKAGRAEPDAKSPLILLAEIAPWNCPNLEVAVGIIKKYELLLHLRGRRLTKSNMELFRSK